MLKAERKVVCNKRKVLHILLYLKFNRFSLWSSQPREKVFHQDILLQYRTVLYEFNIEYYIYPRILPGIIYLIYSYIIIIITSSIITTFFFFLHYSNQFNAFTFSIDVIIIIIIVVYIIIIILYFIFFQVI